MDFGGSRDTLQSQHSYHAGRGDQPTAGSAKGQVRRGNSEYWTTVMGSSNSSNAQSNSSGLYTDQGSGTSSIYLSQMPAGGKSTGKKGGLRRQAIKQFQCDRCPARFERKGHLKSHQETVHEGKKPYKCSESPCNKMFGHSSSLSRHVRNTHSKTYIPPSGQRRKVLPKRSHGPDEQHA